MDLLEAYNFTITEDTLPIRSGRDPEMLARHESLVNVSDEIDKRGQAGIFTRRGWRSTSCAAWRSFAG